MKRYKKLFLALAAVASLYLVRLTGLDAGMIDAVLNATIELMTGEEVPARDVGTPVQVPTIDAERADAEALR